MPLFDDDAETFLGQVYERAEAFLFGRRTLKIFATSWGTGSWGTEQGNNPISVALNTRPKYVASSTITDPQFILLTYPVVVGQGTRLFPDTGPDAALELVESRVTPGAVTIHVYRPSGRPKYATTSD